MVNRNDFEAAQAALNRTGDRLAAALLALDSLLGVIERHALELDPLDRMAIEKARSVLSSAAEHPGPSL